MPEVQLGIPSVIEAALLPMLVGWGKTREMLMLGARINAQQALAWNLVEHIATQDALDTVVETIVGQILNCPPLAVRSQKALIRSWEQLTLKDAVEAGIEALQPHSRQRTERHHGCIPRGASRAKVATPPLNASSTVPRGKPVRTMTGPSSM
jgi:enoyl-CoA hydratase/carnithine racemase